MTIPARRLSVLPLSALLLAGAGIDAARAQPAPIPRAVVPADAFPETMTEFFGDAAASERVVEIAGAEWLQLQFADFDLGGGTMTITDAQGQSQTFTQDELEAWGGLTGIFNRGRLTVTMTPGENGSPSAEIADIVVGLPPGPSPDGPEVAAPQPLRDLLGADLDRFIADDPMPVPEGAPETAPDSSIESICGTDNRTASSHPFSGRIMPIGCTGWIIEGGAILTAGHCIGASTQTLEFNVPASQTNGTTVSPPISEQYRVVADSIVSGFTGIGNDWAVFEVLPNTETGLTAIAAQGGGFTLSDSADPANVTITGYGVDGPPPNFGNQLPRNADNQTQQTHSGALTENTVNGPANATLRYTADTQGGNSGSPVIVAGGGNVAIGIHTNGGCTATGGANAGTSFRNAALWNAIPAPPDGSGVAAVPAWLKLLLHQ